MHREIHIISDCLRLREKLYGADISSLLGVGFYSSNKSGNPEGGAEVTVIPFQEKEAFLSAVGKGFYSPFSEDVVFLAENHCKQNSPVPSLRRWLLAGLQTEVVQNSSQLPVNWSSVTTLPEAIRMLWQPIGELALNLRALQVVFLLPMTKLIRHFQVLGDKLGNNSGRWQDSEIVSETLAWFLSDFVHPNILLVADRHDEFLQLMVEARKITHQMPSGDVTLRL